MEFSDRAQLGAFPIQRPAPRAAPSAQPIRPNDLTFRLTQHHGEFISIPEKPPVTATIHPSAVLRAPTDEDRQGMMGQLVDDLKAVARKLRR